MKMREVILTLEQNKGETITLKHSTAPEDIKKYMNSIFKNFTLNVLALEIIILIFYILEKTGAIELASPSQGITGGALLFTLITGYFWAKARFIDTDYIELSFTFMVYLITMAISNTFTEALLYFLIISGFIVVFAEVVLKYKLNKTGVYILVQEGEKE